MNRTFDRKIDDLINLNEKLIFLVGAGISMDAPSSVPSAKELSRILLKKSVPIEDLDKILNNPNARYELIIEKIKTLIDPDLKFLNYLELVNQPNLNHIFLVQSAKQGAFLITTNFDYLLEFAALKYLNSQNNAEVLPIILKEDYIKYSKVETLRSSQKLPIIKIHGSKKNIITNKDTSSSLVTTLNVFGKDRSKDEIFSIETYKKPLINDIMKDGCLIVMGYSGNDDFDISPLLKDIKGLKKLIWIEHTAENGNIIKIETIKETTNPSKSDKLLLEISQTPINKDLLIYKIKVDTKVLVNELIKLNRFDQFFTKSNQNKNDFNSIPPFEDWLTSTFPEVKDSMKYLLAAYIYYGMFQLEDSFRCIKKADLLFGQEKDDSSDIKAITLAGHIFRLYGVIDEAIKYYNLALSLLKEEDDPKQKASLILNLSLAHESKREHNLSKQFAEKALEIYEKIGDDSGRALALSYIGESYNGWEKYEDALKYLNLALGLVEKTGDLYDKVTILSFIAEVYERWAKSEEAIKRYLEIISIYELLGLYHDEAHASYSLAMVYQVIGKYELAVPILEKAIGLARSVNAVNVLPMLMLKLGEVLIPIKQYDKAISIDKEGIEICKNLKGSEKYIQYFENQINFAKNFK